MGASSCRFLALLDLGVSLLVLNNKFTNLAIMRLYKLLIEYLNNSNTRANRGLVRIYRYRLSVRELLYFL